MKKIGPEKFVPGGVILHHRSVVRPRGQTQLPLVVLPSGAGTPVVLAVAAISATVAAPSSPVLPAVAVVTIAPKTSHNAIIQSGTVTAIAATKTSQRKPGFSI